MTNTPAALRLGTDPALVPRPKPAARSVSALVILFLLACSACQGRGPLEVSGAPSEAFSVQVGQEIDIMVSTAGPGQYDSPPSLTGVAISFLSATAAVSVPSGVQQVFRFTGVTRGQTIVVFHQTNPSGIPHPDIIDTVNVH